MLPAETAQLLDATASFLRRYVVLTAAQAVVIAAWILHTWAFDAAEATPYLLIGSPERESGKTRLLEALAHLVARAWLTGRVTAAVLTRKIDADSPTLLLDESDSAFRGSAEFTEALLGLLNTGYRINGKASLCVRTGGGITFADFNTFCPKAFAGIGALPDTVRSRAIPIEMRRRAPGEYVERLRFRDADAQAAPLRARLEVWAGQAVPILQEARPEIPEALGDRTADCVEPLLAIADLAGGEWPERIRAAIVALTTKRADDDEDESTTVLLLRDIRETFDRHDATRLSSVTILSELNGREERPWGEWRNGQPLTPYQLASLLKRHRIRPDTVRISDNKTAKGYYRKQFEDAWSRYVRTVPEQPSQDLASTNSCDRVTAFPGVERA